MRAIQVLTLLYLGFFAAAEPKPTAKPAHHTKVPTTTSLPTSAPTPSETPPPEYETGEYEGAVLPLCLTVNNATYCTSLYRQ